MMITSPEKLGKKFKEIRPSSLIRLIYISKIVTLDQNVFDHIQNHSRLYNKENGIKGFLCNNSEYFIHCLEGQKFKVFDLMSRIYKDANHRDVKVFFMKEIKKYSFEDWRMRSLNLDDENWVKQAKRLDFGLLLPFKPETWQPWFVDYFINSVKNIDEFNDFEKGAIAYNLLDYEVYKKTLHNDWTYFYIFNGLLISALIVLYIYNHNVVLLN